MTWQDDANCRGLDPALFWPDKNDTATAAAARAVCQGCAVQAECLAHALTRPEIGGIWGGLTPRQRRRLRARTPAPHGTKSRYRTCRDQGGPCEPCRLAYNAWQAQYRRSRRRAG